CTSAVKLFSSFRVADGRVLQDLVYYEARNRFSLYSTFAETTRDKAAELVKESKELLEKKQFHVKRVSIRVNYRAFELVRRHKELTSY
ncbi:MAG: RNA-guided endonuclease InsQ/TnpB family protein, partial [Thermoprotei archaeon]